MTTSQHIRLVIGIIGYIACPGGAVISALCINKLAVVAFMLAFAISGILIVRLMKEIDA